MSLGGIIGGIGGAIIGGVIGFVATGFNPAGAVAGASIGASLGTTLGLLIDPIKPDVPQMGDPGKVDVPKSMEGAIIPDVLGTVMINPQFLAYWGERSVERTREVEGGGSDGGSQTVSEGWDYYLSWIWLLCLGPIDNVFCFQVSNEPLENKWDGFLENAGNAFGTDLTLTDMGLATVYFGNAYQAADSFATTGMGQALPGYVGQAIVVFKDCCLGRNTNRVPMMRVCVRKVPAMSWYANPTINYFDYNAACSIYYVMVNMCEIDSSIINEASFSSVADFCVTNKLGVSINFDSQSSAASYIETILAHIQGVIRWWNGQFYLSTLAMRSIAYTGTQAADTHLTKDDIIGYPTISRKTWFDVINELKVQYSRRILSYTPEDDWEAVIAVRLSREGDVAFGGYGSTGGPIIAEYLIPANPEVPAAVGGAWAVGARPWTERFRTGTWYTRISLDECLTEYDVKCTISGDQGEIRSLNASYIPNVGAVAGPGGAGINYNNKRFAHWSTTSDGAAHFLTNDAANPQMFVETDSDAGERTAIRQTDGIGIHYIEDCTFANRRMMYNRTTDYGRSWLPWTQWRELQPPPLSGLFQWGYAITSHVVVDPITGTFWWAVDNGYGGPNHVCVYSSPDGWTWTLRYLIEEPDIDWQPVQQRLTVIATHPYITVVFGVEQSSNNGMVFASEDGGNSWTKRTPNMPYINGAWQGAWDVFTVTGWNQTIIIWGWAYVGTYERNCMIRSTDGGETWQDITANIPEFDELGGHYVFWAIGCAQGDTFVIFDGYQNDHIIWYSLDSGLHWNILTVDLPAYDYIWGIDFKRRGYY